MLRHRLSILPALAVLTLVGCAASGDPGAEGDAASQPTPEPSVEAVELDEPVLDPTAWPARVFTDGTMPEADAAGQAQADAWLAGVVVPAGAVRLDERPRDVAFLGLQEQGWWCAPMGLAAGYWQVPDMDVIETVNWLAANPGPGLVSSMPEPYADDGAHVDGASVGLVPELGALEGMALTAAVAPGGVVVRAEVGAFGDTTVCPTPPPGEMLGGPGQG
ncbi:hypothetical protein [Agrococcus jejuensis]|uniref:Lipoprotein n=1 Tax=Agrococcus jejuensis TaxID=399736 RepID=A0A1G8H3W6_9MICO|nr:hypothetical protein [Agrococcus jejuensis]SDI01337.1 hypothetical protein SAMN04489720_3203 [Agrococcus jejuensis]